MADQIRRAFSVANLTRAWKWIKSNPESGYKNYFRDLYSAYEVGIDQNLNRLSENLIRGSFIPTDCSKLFFPKPSGLLRPWSLLTVEDQIAYTSIAAIVGEKISKRTRHRYMSTVFGNLFSGMNSDFMYKDWHSCYRAYSESIRSAYDDGKKWTASFDLTACYDSIDHRLLKDRLVYFGIDEDLAKILIEWLCHWTVMDEQSYATEHGIPQGPIASGIISEAVLTFFDESKKPKAVQYARYVDDIRLFASDEYTIRKQLVELDLSSKRIGLFPQSSKIEIHKVSDVDKEIKSISIPPEPIFEEGRKVDQGKVQARILEITKGMKIHDPTRFKYVLGHATPTSKLSIRLLDIAKMYPHLHGPVGRYLERANKHSKGVSKKAMELLREHDLYPAFNASLIRSLRGKIHPDYQASLTKYCKSLFLNKKGPTNPELRASAASVLISSGSYPWDKVRRLVLNSDNWWVRSTLIHFVRVDLVGPHSASSLANKAMRESKGDPAFSAAHFALTHDLHISKPYREIDSIAQHSLKSAKIIQRISRTEDPIQDMVCRVLGSNMSHIDWKKILGKDYRSTTPKIARWRAYSRTDPTAWVNISDTILDMVLYRLHKHDTDIGAHNLGDIGSILQTTSRFARKYPRLFDVANTIHGIRLESDLSHPITRKTGRPTNLVRYVTMKRLWPKLNSGLREAWDKWD